MTSHPGTPASLKGKAETPRSSEGAPYGARTGTQIQLQKVHVREEDGAQPESPLASARSSFGNSASRNLDLGPRGSSSRNLIGSREGRLAIADSIEEGEEEVEDVGGAPAVSMPMAAVHSTELQRKIDLIRRYVTCCVLYDCCVRSSHTLCLRLNPVIAFVVDDIAEHDCYHVTVTATPSWTGMASSGITGRHWSAARAAVRSTSRT